MHINKFLPAAFYFLQNVAGRGGPDKRLGVGVVSGQISPYRRDQLGNILEDATPQSPLCQVAEKPLHHAEPRGTGGGEMELEAGMAFGPCFHGRMLVGRIVITNQVDLFAGRRAPVDQIQKADSLLMPVLFHAGANDLSIGDIEGGEEGSGAIALVVMGHGLAASRFDRQARLGAVQCLDLTLFITREDDGMFGRAQVKAHDIFELFLEVLVVGELEGFDLMGLQPMGGPDTAHRGFTHAGFTRHAGTAPVGRPGGLGSGGELNDL